MHRYIAWVVVISVLVLSLPACGPTSPTGTGTPKEIKLTEKDEGKSVEVAKDGMVGITLEGNPTTGYTWEVDSVDEKVLKLEGEPDFKAESDATGAGGMITINFKAENAGKTVLKLVYHQPWEKDQEPANTFEVTVTVK